MSRRIIALPRNKLSTTCKKQKLNVNQVKTLCNQAYQKHFEAKYRTNRRIIAYQRNKIPNIHFQKTET